MKVLLLGEEVGTISKDNNVINFEYNNLKSRALSVSMPNNGVSYNRINAWFDNLLPDSDSIRKSIAKRNNIGNNTYDLLGICGLDLPGAVQVFSDDKEYLVKDRAQSYIKAEKEDIEKRLSSLKEENHSPWITDREHWSLGGNQSKLALRKFKENWFYCEGAAASNVIIKPGIGWIEGQHLHELVSMRLAKRVGLDVADVSLEKFGGTETIVIERYDRITDSLGNVHRIHQEDLCQVFNIYSSKKYTEDGGPSSIKILKMLDEYSPDDKIKFADYLIYNYLIAATDAHAKNYSLLHLDNGIKLAPMYDVATAFELFTDKRNYKTAMNIGGENRIGYVRKSSFERLAEQVGIDSSLMLSRVEEMREQVMAKYENVLNEFSDSKYIDKFASTFIPRLEALNERNKKLFNGSSFDTNFFIGEVKRYEDFHLNNDQGLIFVKEHERNHRIVRAHYRKRPKRK